ncbi:DUF4864 domain-containing protein [Roseovarius dicentrarchi]|uniref:DUF4864 domain-containing protein n=1 Tax=Roseovarius dicentrarchi TaxID=2250573 RepID=UPI000DE98965|nr:DUF4864 domain-containing protein [Roseovarius dicentrarchi]
MKHLLLAFCLIMGLGLGHPSRAQEEPIRAVISAQIAAFEADDFDAAFAFASPTIQGMFGSAQRFGAMVRTGYPMVWRPDEVTFLALDQRDGLLWQDVLVRDRNGALHILEYQMEQGPTGWKINAVTIRRATAGTA